MKVLVLYGMHRNEYTDIVAKAVANGLMEDGFDVRAEKALFSATGLGKALAGRPLEEVKESLKEPAYWLKHIESSLGSNVICDPQFSKYSLEEFLNKSALGSHVILDFHTTPEMDTNPNNTAAENLGFRYDGEFRKGHEGSITFLWLGNLYDAGRNWYSIEVPQVYRKASKPFLDAVKRKMGNNIEFDGIGADPDDSIESYFAHFPDKKAAMQKYPPHVLAKTIIRGTEKEILSGEFLKRMG